MLYLCSMKLLQLETRTYTGREYKEFMRSQEETEEEGNEWKKALGDGPKMPRAHRSRVLIDPTRIIMAVESCSLEELTNNPEEPTFDSVDLCLEDGIQLSLTCDMDEFIDICNALDEENVA